MSTHPAALGKASHRSGRLALPGAPATLLVLGIVVGVLYYGGMGTSLLWNLFLGDRTEPVQLPADLVLRAIPSAACWDPDPLHGGILLSSSGAVERLERPWQDPTPEPLAGVGAAGVPFILSPSGTYVMLPARTAAGRWQVSRGFLIHDRKRFEEVGALPFGDGAGRFSGDDRLVAVCGQREPGRYETQVAEWATQKVLTTLEVGPAALKALAWHPRSNVLVIGSHGRITLAAEPTWRPRILATAVRNQAEWLARCQARAEETFYHPNENPYQLTFGDDGKLLICAMDRGLRIYAWEEVLAAERELPAPLFTIDSDLVSISIAQMKHTYAAVYDPNRHLVLFSGLGTLKFLELTTGASGTLLTLPKDAWFNRLELDASGEVLCGDVVQMGRYACQGTGLFLLDYPRLLARGGIGAAPPAHHADAVSR
jgi:hypothetical protein